MSDVEKAENPTCQCTKTAPVLNTFEGVLLAFEGFLSLLSFFFFFFSILKRIPSKFLKHISNELSNRATLKVRSGCSWNAKVSETSSSGIFIEDGWHQFLKDNSLGNNEFLLFTYEGNMCFNVQIFEVNGCERLNLPLIGTHQLSASTSTKP